MNIHYKVFSIAFNIMESTPDNYKGYLMFTLLKSYPVLELKFNTDTSKHKFIRHIYLFNKRIKGI